jgi:hypothetical protein
LNESSTSKAVAILPEDSRLLRGKENIDPLKG